MEASQAFAETGGEEAAGQVEETSQEGAAPEGQEEAAPDLSEQEQALAAKISSTVTEQLNGAQQEQAEPEPDPGSFFESLLDDPEDPDEPEGSYEEEPAAEQAQEQDADQVLEHPVVQQILQSQEQTIAYLQQREEREQRQALNDFAEKNPDIMKPEVLRDVKGAMHTIAERAGDPRMAQDPEVLSIAFDAVMARRAAAAREGSEPAPEQGAPIERDAGASAQGGASSEDQFRANLRAAGGSAFPS